MRLARRITLFAVLAIALTVAGCDDAPAGPDASPDASASLLGLGGTNTVKVVKRTVPLAQDEVVSKVVGPAGGVLVLPRAGLSVVVPLGALTQPTRITITAPAGDLVGYRFQPHGLQFRRPLVASQSILGTELSLRTLLGRPVAAYVRLPLAPEMRALEILDLRLDALLNLATFRIEHFSGYVLATD